LTQTSGVTYMTTRPSIIQTKLVNFNAYGQNWHSYANNAD
jgi:hypothetical protein